MGARMKKNKILLLSIATLFLNGCSCSIISNSHIVENKVIDKTKTEIPQTNPGGSGGNGGKTGTEIISKNDTYKQEGEVSLEGRLEFWEEMPTPVISSRNGVASGTEKYFYTDVENKLVPVDLNNLSPWQLYSPPYDMKMTPGEYTLIAYYVNNLGEKCYTSTFDYTVYKGKIDPEFHAISNGEHIHILPYTENTKTLADVEEVLADYVCFYLDEGHYESMFDFEGTVVFDDNTLPLETGRHVYTLVFADNYGYYEPFKCDVSFNVVTQNIKTSDVKLILRQSNFQKTVTYGQGDVELDYTGEAYALSLEETAFSEFYEINLRECSNSIINPGIHTIVVSLKSKNLLFWLNDDGSINFGDLNFTVTINKVLPIFELDAYFNIIPVNLSPDDRCIDGDTRTMYVNQMGMFHVYKGNGNENKIGEISYDCEVNFITNDGCVKKYEEYDNVIRAIRPGKAIVEIVFSKTTFYLEKVVARIEINVLNNSETYTFQNADYYCDEDSSITVYKKGNGFDEQYNYGVYTLGGEVSGFYCYPNGAVSMSLTCSFYNINPNDNSYICINAVDEYYHTIDKTNLVSSEDIYEVKISCNIPKEYRNSKLLVEVRNNGSGMGIIYLKSLTFFFA